MISNFLKLLSGIPNTIWGVLIVLVSMYIAVKYNHDTGLYFAAIGTALLGINQATHTNTTTTVDSKPPVKVETDASNNSGKD